MTDPILSYSHIASLSSETNTYLQAHFIFKAFKKGDQFLWEGEKADKVFLSSMDM